MTRSRRPNPVFALLAALLFAAPVCVPDPEPAPPPGEPPDTVLDPRCDSKEQANFCWRGVDTDGQVVGYELQLVRVDEAYYETGGTSGDLIESMVPVADNLWTMRDDRTDATFSLGRGSYLFRVRAVDDDGNPDPTPAETLWQSDPYPPTVTILSGCGALYPEPSPLVMTCDASDVGTDRRPSPRTDLMYSFELYPTYDTGQCPAFSMDAPDWQPFPDEGTPVRLVFDHGGRSASRSAASGEVACEWFFSFAVRDPAGNIGSAACRIMILR